MHVVTAHHMITTYIVLIEMQRTVVKNRNNVNRSIWFVLIFRKWHCIGRISFNRVPWWPFINLSTLYCQHIGKVGTGKCTCLVAQYCVLLLHRINRLVLYSAMAWQKYPTIFISVSCERSSNKVYTFFVTYNHYCCKWNISIILPDIKCSGVSLKRGLYAQQLSKKTPYRFPVRARHGVSLVNINCDLCHASITVEQYSISWYDEPRYYSTRL